MTYFFFVAKSEDESILFMSFRLNITTDFYLFRSVFVRVKYDILLCVNSRSVVLFIIFKYAKTKAVY